MFSLVAAASWFARDVVGPHRPNLRGAGFFVPTFVAAFLIGLRFRSWSWLAEPTVVFSVLLAGLALTTDPAVVIYLTEGSPLISSRAELVRLFAFVGLVAGFVVFAIPVLLGVW